MNAELRDFFTRRSPGTGKAILGLWLACWLSPAFASGLPQGGTITHGQGQISTPSATQMQIDQYSQRMAADFYSFDIAKDHGVNISQPGAESLFVGRITGESATQIFGTLTANGQVMLLNPRGVVFGEGSRVDTATLMASTLNVDVDRVMDGMLELEFSADIAGKIINRGTLTAATGGSVTLLGDEVINEGLIVADMGRVNLASGSKAFVTFDAERLIGVRVTQGALGGTGGESAVANFGEIQANGGQILLTADAARDLFSMAVNNEGVLRANAAEVHGGEVRLLAQGGDTFNSGTIEATASSGQGGNIEVLGDRVAVTGGRLDASGATGGGDIKIGGAFQGRGDTPTASHTYVGPDAQIAADATAAGDGGEVIVWADNTTRFHGEISARGGPDGGDGGFVEVSGKEHLAYRGSTDTRAPEGRSGTLLLDPDNITIEAGAASADDAELDVDTPNPGDPAGSILFADGGASDFTISAGKIEAELANATVVLQAENDIFQSAGAGIDVGAVGAALNNGLTLQAGRHITLSDGITLNNGALTLSADDPGQTGGSDGVGNITVGGAITLNGGDFFASGFAVNLTSMLSTNGGDVSVSAVRNISMFGADISTAGGSISMNGNLAGGIADNFGGVVVDNATLDVTGGGGTGAISLTGTGGDVADLNYGVLLRNGAQLLASGGPITLNGTGGAGGVVNIGVRVQGPGTEIRSVDGDINITGVGGAGTGNSNLGVFISDSAKVSSTGLGASAATITIDGTGGASGGIAHHGVEIAIGGQVMSVDGNILIDGEGGGLAGSSNNAGLIVRQTGGKVSSTGGNITLTGTGGAGNTTDYGIWITGAEAEVSSVDGSISATATAGAGTVEGFLLGSGATLASTNGVMGVTTLAGDILIGGALSTGSSLSLNSFGALSGAASADVDVTGNADLTAGAGGIDFATAGSYDLGSLTFNSAGDVAVTDETGIVLAGVSTADNLDLTATTGAISGNATNADVTVTGLANLSASGAAGAIALNSALDSYNFGSLTFNSNGNVAISLDAGTSFEGASSADNLVVTAAGTIEVNSLASVMATAVTGTAEIIAQGIGADIVAGAADAGAIGGGSVTLDASGKVGNFDSTFLNTNTLNLVATGTTMGISNATELDTLTVRTTSGGTVVVYAGATDELTYFIDVDPDEFTFVGAGTDFDFTTDFGDILLVGTSTAASLSLNAMAGAITDDAGSIATVTGNASLSGTSITLDETNAFGSLTFNSGGAVSIAEVDGTELTGTSTANSLILASGGALTDDGTVDLDVTNNATLSGTSITLEDAYAFGSLAFNSAGAVAITEVDATELTGTSTADSLILDSAGGITNTMGTNLTVMGNADFDGSSIALGSFIFVDNFNFGSLTFNSGGDVSIIEASAMHLVGTSTADSLSLGSAAGALTNAASASLLVAGNATFFGSTITLGDQVGDSFNFGSLTLSTLGGAVSVAEDSATELANSSNVGSLQLTSAGAITNAELGTLVATGGVSLSGSSITLGDQSGDSFLFQDGLSFNSAGAVSIAADGAVNLIDASTAESLLLNVSGGGGISNAADASLLVVENASFDAGSITLGNQTDDNFGFGSLTFNAAGGVSIAEDADTQLDGTSTAGSLLLTSSGALTNVANTNLTVTGNASFDASSITLGDQATDSFSFGSLTFNSGGAVSIAEDAATQLTGMSTADSLVLTSTGALTNAANATLAVNGNASLGGTSITFGNQTDDDFSFGSLTFDSAGAVMIEEDAATLLAGESIADSLTLTSIAAITNDDTADLDVTNNASLAGTSITLGDQVGDLFSFGSLTFNSAGAVNIAEDAATQLAGDSTADSLVLTSTAGISNAGAATLDVANNADFDGTSITLGDQGGDDFQFGSLTFNSAGAVAIDEDADMILVGTNNALTAALTSIGSITVNGGVTTTGNSISMIADDFVEVNANLTATADGDIYLEGQGLNAGNYSGVSINDVAVTSVGGDIILIGSGGDTGDDNRGVYVQGLGGLVQTSDAGEIFISGQGGAGNGAVGFLQDGGGALGANGVVAIGTGDVIVVGTGGANGERNRGIQLRNTAALGSMSGQVSLNGAAGAMGPGDSLTGVVIDASIVATLDGGIDISGTGSLNAADGTSGHHGVRIVNGSVIESDLGTGISITGTGGSAGAGTVNGSHGIIVLDSDITADGGPVTLSGTALEASPAFSESFGVVLFESDVFTESGALTLNATAVNAAGLITNSLDSTVPGTGVTNIGSDLNTGLVTLNVANDGSADSLVFLGTTRVLGAGDLRIQPDAIGTSIGIGDGAVGNLNLSQAEVAAIDDGFDSIAIGRVGGEHVIQVGSAIFLDPTTIETTGVGTLTVVGGQTLLGGGGQDVDGDGHLTLGSLTPINLNGNISTHSTDITLAGNVLVAGPRTLNSQLSGAGGNVTITGAIDGLNVGGTDGLTILAGAGSADLQGNVEGDSGAVTVTGGNDLQNLTITAGVVDLADVRLTDGNLLITADDVNLNGAIYRTHSTGDITFTADLILSGNLALTADTGTVAFNGALDSDLMPRTLTINAGTASFGGAVGSLSPLGLLDISGAALISGGSIRTTGNQLYGGVVTLGANAMLETTMNGSVDFNSTISGRGQWSLDILTAGTGVVTFGGDVGGAMGTDLAGLSVESAVIALDPNVDFSTASTSGDISIVTDDFRLDGNNTVNAGGGTFAIRPLDGASTIEFAATKTLIGPEVADVFINSAFADVSAGRFVVGGAGQSGDIFVGNAGNAVMATYDLEVDTTGGIQLRNNYAAAAMSDRDLTLIGDAGIAIAGAGPWTVSLNGGAFAAESQVTLATGLVVNASGGISFNSTVDGTFDLSLAAGAGDVVLGGAVGAGTALDTFLVASAAQADLASVQANAVSVTAASIGLNGGLYESLTGDIALSGDVVLGAAVTLDSSGGAGDIGITGTVDSDDDGTRRDLSLIAGAGSVDLQGAVGATAAIDAFFVDGAATADLAAVRAQSLVVTADAIFLNGMAYTALTGGLDLDGDVTLENDVTLDSSTGGDLVVTGSIDSDATARDLNLLAGAGLVDLQGSVGAIAALDAFVLGTTGDANLDAVAANSILASANELNLAGNLTSLNGDIGLNGNVRLLGTLVFDSSAANGDIDISGTINGAAVNSQGLTLTAGTGAVELVAAVGGTEALTDFTVISAASADLASLSAETISVSASAINLNGSDYLTTAGVTFTGNTTLNTAVSVDSGTGADGIAFNGTLDGGQALNLSAGTGDISFTGVVGGNTALGAVTVNATNNLTADAAFTAASVNQAAPGTGTTSFGGLLTAKTGTINLDANEVTLTDGARSFGQAVTLTALDGNVTVSGSGITTTAAMNSGVTSGAIVIDVLGSGAVDITAPLITTGADNNAGSGSGGGLIDIGTNGGGISVATGPVNSDGGAAVGGNNAGGAAGNVSLGGGLITLNGSSFSAAGGAGAGAGAPGAGASVSFDSNVLLATGAAAITTGATGGSIAFNAALDGGQDLSLTAGTGSISFVGAVGTDRLGALNIVSANNVTANAVSAASISQLAGSGTSTFNGALNTNTAAGISLLGNNAVLNAGVTTSGGGVVTTDLGGTLTIVAAGDINASGAVSLEAAGGITTAGDVVTAGSNVSFVSATRLNGPVAIDTGTGVGDIRFASTVNGGQNLALAAGAGDVDFVGAVGGITRLGAVEIESANDVTANALTTASLSQLAGTGTTTFNGAVNTDAAAGVSLTGFDLAVNAGVTTSNAGAVTFDMGNTIAIAPAGDINADGAVNLTAAAGITTAGDITTAGADVDFLSPTTLVTNAVAMSTGAGAGDINFADTLDGGQNLTLSAGAGSIGFTGAVGGTSRLGVLQIVSANNVTANAMTLASLNQVGGSGTTTLNGLLDTAGAAGVSLIGFDLALNAGINTSNGGGVSANMSGVITIDAAGDINASGPVSLTAVGGITTAGDIVTDQADVTFASATSLSDAVAIDTGVGTGNVNFASSLDGGNDLSLTAGTGNIGFAGVVGGTDALGAMEIVSANDVTANAMTLASLSQLAGSGITTLNGVVNAAGNISLTGTAVAVNQAVNTSAGGNLTVAMSDTATFASNADVNVDGAVSLTAANGISTAGDVTSSGGNVDFFSATTLTGPVAVATSGGDLTFTSTLDGNQNLTVNAGSGAVSFAGLVGDQTRLGALTIDNAGNLTANGIRAASLTQAAGTGTTTFNGGIFTDAVTEAVNVTGSANVSSGNISLQQRLTAGTSVALSSSGTTTIAAVGDIGAGAGVTLTAGGGITTAGDVNSNGGAITFASPSTLSGPVALASNGGDVTLAAMAGAAQNLTLNAGAGALSLASLSNGGSVNFLGAGSASIGNLAAEAATVNAGGSYGFNGTVTIANALTLNALDSATFAGSVAAGSFAGNAAGSTVTFNGATSVTGALAITDGAQVNVNGTLAAGTMTAAATATGIAFNDTVNVSGATNLANTGMTAFGNDGDIQTFAGGLNAAGPITTFATLRTAGQALTLGGVTQTGNTVLDTTNNGGSAAGAALSVGPLVGAGFDLDLRSGTGGATTLAGVTGGGTVDFLSASTVTVNGGLQAVEANFGAANAFTVAGALDLGSLDTSGAGGASVTLTGGGSVTAATVFENTGDVNLGNGSADRFLFVGGLDVTGTMLNLNGIAATDSTAISVGSVTLTGDSQLDSSNGADLTQTPEAGADVTFGDVTGTAGGEVLQIMAGAGNVAATEGTAVSNVGSFFVRSSNELNLGPVQTNGNSIRTLSAGDVNLNGDLTSALGDISIISTGGSVAQGLGTVIESTAGSVHLLAFDDISLFALRAPSTEGSVLLGLLAETAGGQILRLGEQFPNQPDILAGNLIAVVSSGEADFGLSDDGMRLQGTQQFFGMNGGEVFIRESNAAPISSLPLSQQTAFVSVLEQTAPDRVIELQIDTELLFAARNSLGQGGTTVQRDADALREFQAQTQQSDEEEVLAGLGEEVFLDIALFDYDRERPLCLPGELQGPDSAPCSSEAVAAWFDRLADELLAAAARESVKLRVVQKVWPKDPAALSSGGQ